MPGPSNVHVGLSGCRVKRRRPQASWTAWSLTSREFLTLHRLSTSWRLAQIKVTRRSRRWTSALCPIAQPSWSLDVSHQILDERHHTEQCGTAQSNFRLSSVDFSFKRTNTTHNSFSIQLLQILQNWGHLGPASWDLDKQPLDVRKSGCCLVTQLKSLRCREKTFFRVAQTCQISTDGDTNTDTNNTSRPQIGLFFLSVPQSGTKQCKMKDPL